MHEKPPYEKYDDDPRKDEEELSEYMLGAVSARSSTNIIKLTKGVEARLAERGCDLDSPDGLAKLSTDSPLRKWSQSLQGLNKEQRQDPYALFKVLDVHLMEYYLNESKREAMKIYQESGKSLPANDYSLYIGFQGTER